MNKEIFENSISISEVNEYIKEIFDNSLGLQNIILRGEISNFNGVNRSGHIYFTLKDDKSSIKAVIFKYDVQFLDFDPKDGDNVFAIGSISSYPPNGTYQIIIKRMMSNGDGDILLKKELLRKKLDKEGLFDADHKLPLPKFPIRIAVITGLNSAAAKDIEVNILRRFPLCTITQFNSLVQGQEAAKDLINQINLSSESNPDLIIIARGGGSIEDLSAFDDEDLVRTIYICKIPIISAVGHEINKTFCDFVADGYASTPTGAAELAVPDCIDILEEIKQDKYLIDSVVSFKINEFSNKISSIKNSKYLVNVENNYDKFLIKLESIKNNINNIMNSKFIYNESKLEKYINLINAFNPENVLRKGYSIISDKKGNIIKRADNVSINDNLKAKLYDGELILEVKEKKDNG